jgi:hypothetical protein
MPRSAHEERFLTPPESAETSPAPNAGLVVILLANLAAWIAVVVVVILL